MDPKTNADILQLHQLQQQIRAFTPLIDKELSTLRNLKTKNIDNSNLFISHSKNALAAQHPTLHHCKLHSDFRTSNLGAIQWVARLCSGP